MRYKDYKNIKNTPSLISNPYCFFVFVFRAINFKTLLNY